MTFRLSNRKAGINKGVLSKQFSRGPNWSQVGGCRHVINRGPVNYFAHSPSSKNLHLVLKKFLCRSQHNTDKIIPLVKARGTRNPHNEINAIYKRLARIAYKRLDLRVLDVISPSQPHIVCIFRTVTSRRLPRHHGARSPSNVGKGRAKFRSKKTKKLRRQGAPIPWKMLF